MFTPSMWKKINKIHDNLGLIMVSFDAALPSTYSITRRDGNWDRLVENTKFLAEKRNEGKFKVLRLDFVVQDLNYKEMPMFATLAKSFGPLVDTVCFSMVTDWGTWDKATFNQRAVWRKVHPEFDSFMDVLRSPELQDSNFIDMSNLHAYFVEANK